MKREICEDAVIGGVAVVVVVGVVVAGCRVVDNFVSVHDSTRGNDDAENKLFCSILLKKFSQSFYFSTLQRYFFFQYCLFSYHLKELIKVQLFLSSSNILVVQKSST